MLECCTYGLTQTVAPLILPVTTEEMMGAASTWSRNPSQEDRAMCQLLLAAATEKVEEWTGRQLMTATHALTLDWFPAWEIQLPSKEPWQSITSITYYDTDGATQTVSAADYILDADTGRIEPIEGGSWPATQPRVGAVTVTFVAGYGDDAEDVPAGLRLTIMALVLDWLTNRALKFSIPPGIQEQLQSFMPGRQWV